MNAYRPVLRDSVFYINTPRALITDACVYTGTRMKCHQFEIIVAGMLVFWDHDGLEAFLSCFSLVTRDKCIRIRTRQAASRLMHVI